MKYKKLLEAGHKTRLQTALDPVFVQQSIDSISSMSSASSDTIAIRPKTIFKRPQKVLATEQGSCQICSLDSTITTHQPKKKAYTDIIRSVCVAGHVVINIHQRLNVELGKSRG